MKVMRWVLLLASAVILSIIFMGSILPTNPVSPRATAQTNTARIYNVDIGQGAGTLIVSPTGKSMLVDAGPNGGGTNKIIPLLNTLGINTIDFTAVTHYHIDHIAGITEVLNANRVAGIAYDNGDGANVAPPNPGGTQTAFNNYKAATNRPGVTRQQLLPGTVIDMGGGMTVTCIAAGGNLLSGGSVFINTADINGQSLALLVEYNNFDYLVAGDLTGAGSTSTAQGPDVETFVGQLAGDVDVIQLNHHGSTTSSNPRLLTASKAEIAFAQIADNNTFGHPNREVVNRFLNTPTTNGNTFDGTGVPTAGTTPIFYQTQSSPPTDTRTTVQGISGAVVGNGGNGTILLETNGTTTYTIRSFDDGGVKIPLTTYNVDGASAGLTTDFPPTVIPSVNPTVPLATEAGVVTAVVHDRENPISSVTLNFSLNGVAQSPLTMSLTSPNTYQATIPAQANGTRVDFTINATANGKTTSFSDGYFSGTAQISNIKTLNAKGEALYREYAARIQGLVTAGTGVYSTSGANNDYVQDASGGINVARTTQPSTPAIQPTAAGQMVEVRGRIGMLDGNVRLEVTPRFAETTSPFGITTLSSNNTVTPSTQTLSALNGNLEGFEGRLVSISNATVMSGTIPTAPASVDGFLTVTDGTGTFMLKIDKDTNVPGLATPSGPFTLVGIVQQDDPLRPFTSNYSITPRSRVDLGAPDPGATILPIADARVDMVDNSNGTPPTDFVPDLINQQVKVRGVVTSIDFRGGAGIELYIQDQTGGVTIFSTSDFGPFAIGTNVEVFGTVVQFNGLTEINPGAVAGNITTLPMGTLPTITPQIITLSQLANNGIGEALEGRLVRVNNVTITSGTFPATNGTANLTISDNTGSATLRIDGDTNIDGTPTPTGAFSLIGLVSQFDSSAPFDSGYQIFPRSTADIIAGGVAPVLTTNPTTVSFGNVNVGSNAMSSVMITNTSDSSVTLTTPFTITGTNANQFTVGLPATLTLNAMSSTTVNVTFAPTSTGAKTAMLNIGSSAGSATVMLTGSGQAGGGPNLNTALVISEFRFRGPAGGNDEFVEIYNNTDSPINIGGLKLRGSNSNTPPAVADRATIPTGTMLPARGHYLFVNNAASGYSGTVPGDRTYNTGIVDTGGIALTMADNTIIDQVGLNVNSAFKEGNVLPNLGTTTAANLNRGYERKPGGGSGSTQDTNDNLNDFMLLTPSDPQNLASAPVPSLQVAPTSLNFASVAVGSSANLTVTITNGAGGTITLNTPFSVTGTNANQFSVQAPASTTLGPNASMMLTVTFRPTSAGTKTANLSITSNGGSGMVSLMGAGTVAGAGLNPKLYIADTGNNRIQILDPVTSTFTAFGLPGTGAANLNMPQGVTSNGNTGDIYVADTRNNAVKMFSSAGAFIKVVAGPGTANGQVNAPEAVAFDNTQNILYVADTNNSRIMKFTAAGTFIGIVAGPGTTPGKVNKPQGISLDNAGNLYVADTLNNRIQKFSSTGTFLMVFANLGTAPGLMNQPKGVAVDPTTGDILVADSGNNRIQRFTGAGAFLSIVASAGTGLNQVNRPEGVRVNNLNGAIIVSDTGNNRVLDVTNQLILGSTGRASNTANPGLFGGPTGMQ